MKTKVLHLSLSHGGGIISALETYIINSPLSDHYLVAANDDSCQINISNPKNLVNTYIINLNFKGILSLYEIYKQIKPTHIHLHSSIAGVVGRLIFPFFKNVIYTPHCYAFERTDISKIKRCFFYFAERLLALKPTTVAGCSPREVTLGNELAFKVFKKKISNIFLTNYSSITHKWQNPNNSIKRVIMIGRICPQKDANFFIQTFKQLQLLDSSIKFYWIGNGADNDINKLLLNGITCSGWLSREELVDEVLNSDLYFHCAAWEGNPMSVLEVSRMEMPIVGRKIPSLESIGLKQLSTTPEGCAQLIYKHFNNKDSLFS